MGCCWCCPGLPLVFLLQPFNCVSLSEAIKLSRVALKLLVLMWMRLFERNLYSSFVQSHRGEIEWKLRRLWCSRIYLCISFLKRTTWGWRQRHRGKNGSLYCHENNYVFFEIPFCWLWSIIQIIHFPSVRSKTAKFLCSLPLSPARNYECE